MRDTRGQLKKGAVALALIDVLREESGIPRLGVDLEMAIVDHELRDLVFATAIDDIDHRLKRL